MRRGAGHRGATPGCRPRRQWRAQPHINKDFLINPIVHYRKSYFKFEMPGPFAVMRAARLVFAQSGRQGPRLSGLVAAHTGSPHCPGWRVAPGPMARRCSHLMMIAPAGRPTATEASPRRPEGLFGFQPNRLPGRLPVVALRMPYSPPFSFPHVLPCPPPACSLKAAAQWHARRNRQLETDCRQTGHSHANVFQGSKPGCGAPYNRLCL